MSPKLPAEAHAARVRRAPILALCLLVATALTMRVTVAGDLPGPGGSDLFFAQPGIFGTEPRHLAWSPDARLLAFSWAQPGEPRRSLWLVDDSGERLRRLSDASASASVAEHAWLGDGSGLLFLRGGSLWRVDLASGREHDIRAVGDAQDLRVAPDPHLASYLRDGDLWLLDLETGQEEALTRVGLPPLSQPPTGRYSRPEREIGPGIWGGPTYAWSADGRHIAVHHVDRRGMRRVSFPNYLAAETEPNFVRRGYPGDANEARRVAVLDVASRSFAFLDLEEPESHQIIGFDWSAGGDLLIDVASDTNTLRRIYIKRAGDDRARLHWESRRDSRIYTHFASAWAADGNSIVVLSDHENFYGLYRLSPETNSGSLLRLDDGDHDVLSAPAIATRNGALFYAATAGNPAEQHIYRRDRGSSAAQRITRHAGHHSAYPSPTGDTLAVVRSDDRSPPELYLLHSGQTPRRITRSPAPAFDDFPLAEARYLTAPGPDGGPDLHIRLLLPADFDSSRRYPVLFGPMYSNTVRNRWGYAYTLMQQALTQRGYLVAQVDMRGSTGYGRAFREAFLNDFAGGDIEDVAAAAAHLQRQPFVAADRLGIWGSSYGGTLTVYTLLAKPGLFRAGVAAAAAVDPRFFGTDDVAIVRRPGDGSGIFERRAEDLVERLEDRLLLVHGLQDQVVPFRTVAALTDAFIRAGKPVETAFLPGATHGWRREPPYDRYVFDRLVDFFDRHLMPPAIRLPEMP